MSSFLALAAAIVFGASDFLGGAASRQAPSRAVTARAQLVSAALLVPLVLTVSAPHVRAADVWWGAAAGVGGGLALVLLYAALGDGPMSVVAPLAALAGALVPVGYGLASGDRPGAVALAGVALALIAIPVVSAGATHLDPTPPRVVGLAFVAGAGFGLFAICLKQTDPDAGLWPLVGARAVSVPMIFAIALFRGGTLRLPGPARGTSTAAGALDIGANALILMAVQRGELTIAAVLGGLYPACTVLLARTVLHERLARRQVAGLVGAGAAIALIAIA
jgi:drug/metabolite transporter (DMT)-like permease